MNINWIKDEILDGRFSGGEYVAYLRHETTFYLDYTILNSEARISLVTEQD